MRFRLALTAASLVASMSVATSFAQGTDSPKIGDEKYKPSVGQSGKDVIWVPTNDAVAEAMLKMANVKPGDLVYDLGSGDGKIAIAAAKNFGATAVGIEFNKDMADLATRNAERAGVADKVKIINGDDIRFSTIFPRSSDRNLNEHSKIRGSVFGQAAHDLLIMFC